MPRKPKPRPRGGVPGKHASPGSGSVYQIKTGPRAGAFRGAQLVTFPNGERKRIYVVGQDEADARAQLEQRAAEAEGRVLPPDDSEITVSQWLGRWLTSDVKLGRRASTFDAHTGRAAHIERFLGATPLRDLAAPAVGWMLGQLATAPQPRGKRRPQPLSAASVGMVLTTLRTAVRAAVDQGVLDADPIARVKAPRVEPREYQIMPDDQLRRVLTSAQEMQHPLLAAFFLYATTAMRRGEVVGLHWPDIDLRSATIGVVRQRTRNYTQGAHQAPPKTAAGRRKVAFPAQLVSVLEAHRAAQHEARLRARPPWPDVGPFVFLTAQGRPYAPETFDAAWRQLLRKVGVPHIRLHDLRHTVASQMIGDGESFRMVAELLGHANVNVTLNTYAHVIPNSQAGAVGRRGDAILPQTAPVAVHVAVQEGSSHAC